VLDQIPCTVTITNVGAHRLALAIGEPVVRLDLHQAPAATPAPPHGREGKAAKPAPAAPPSARAAGGDAGANVTDADLALLAGHFVELAPGESVRRDVTVGPVKTAGHYDVHAGVIDLARPLLAGGSGENPDPIESVASLRFEP
jgi:hypothetical protein